MTAHPVPTILSLQALGRALRRLPIAPTSVAAFLGRQEAYAAFRRIVQDLFPAEADAILATQETGANRESARVWAFLRWVEVAYFPCIEVDEYEQVVAGIPFARNSWSYERFHDLEMRPGELLLFALCAQPYEPDADTRVALLDAVEAHVPRTTLAEIPPGGLAPAELREQLDGTPYAAAADFADWLWGETGSVFLDLDDEVDITDADWTPEVVRELTEQWQRATSILDRIGALADWLEADPPIHFGRLLDAALGRDAHLNYLHERRHYGLEITEAGLVPIPRDDESLALPLDVTV